MKPYYQDDAVTIYLGDCREILPQLEPVDLVLTDPPYGVGYAEWDSRLIEGWLDICLKLSPLVLVITGTTHCEDYPRADWILSWARPGSVQRANGGGFSHWEPIKVYGRNPFDVDCKVFLADTRAGDLGHPCPKPLSVMKWLIEGSKISGIILDPFMGSGTTLRAAKDLGRKAIGIEIEEKYCEIAARRMSQEVLDFGSVTT